LDRSVANLIDPAKSLDGFMPAMGEPIPWKQAWLIQRRTPDAGAEDATLELLYNAARCATRDVLEIGSYKGRSTVYLAAGVKLLNNPSIRVIAIDPFVDPEGVGGLPSTISTRPEFEQNLKLCCVDDVVDIIQASSEFVTAQIRDYSVDVLFIDGDHTYEGVKRDFELYFSKVAVGGVIIFHDATKGYSSFPDVVKLMDELVQDVRLNYLCTSGGAVAWYKVSV